MDQVNRLNLVENHTFECMNSQLMHSVYHILTQSTSSYLKQAVSNAKKKYQLEQGFTPKANDTLSKIKDMHRMQLNHSLWSYTRHISPQT